MLGHVGHLVTYRQRLYLILCVGELALASWTVSELTGYLSHNAFNDYKLAIDGGKVCDLNCIVNNLLSIQILSQCVLKILNIHIDIFLFQLVGMITRYNLTHEYMEHCLENLGWN